MTQTQTAPQPVHRKDYRPSDYLIGTVELLFQLEAERTFVRSKMTVTRNPAADGGERPLVLQGEDVDLRCVRLNGRELAVGEYEVVGETLVIPGVPESFEVETEVIINPKANLQLSGLYLSDGIFCTQCEAEGFRRITYFLDRPDVMATYRVRVEGSKEECPVLLSNGNRLATGDLEGGRHFAEWEDPFPKPSYLFALVAGPLKAHTGTFTTRSGREVALEIWVEPQNLDKCDHALKSLQNSMAWDETTFGLEYDLDIYMVVAVNSFNMGAMENKGLNVFNSKYVLARPDTATDDDYEGIEGVIGHEYFHNWTGNRVTCRDWFQLTLKEGLTVFRDQEFSAEMTSAAVKRISEVRILRTSQFAEDAGPMAHPIRPESYVSMDNFYTSTVYVKGAEVVRMYQTLLGVEGFRKGMDLYFERHDGQAVACDDFRAAMADANDRDLSQFERWYLQAGTPVIEASGTYDADAKTYALTLSQSAPTVDGNTPKPFHIPVSTGLLGAKGDDLLVTVGGEDKGAATTHVLELTREKETFVFEGVEEPPVPSLLRGFSAPVKLRMDRSDEELAFLMGHDSDPFQRWDAGQTLAQRLLLGLIEDQQAGRELKLEDVFVDAVERVLLDPQLDGSLKSLALVLPPEKLLGQEVETIDPDAIHAARRFVVCQLAERLELRWVETYEANLDTTGYSNDKASIDRRALKNRALGYLCALESELAIGLALRQFETADNMTDGQAALACLTGIECKERDQALTSFYERWKDDPLVLDKWFTLQASSPLESTFERVLQLSQHADFTLSVPNRVRALIGAFAAGNQVRFHRADGRAYEWHADRILELDALNPQIASRMVSVFNPWKRFESGRRDKMKTVLERIAGHAGLSKDTGEIVERALKR